MQKNINVLYFVMIVTCFLSVLCFDNILFIWILMEIQTMCYICVLNLKSLKTSYLMSFLVVQLFAGVLLLYFCFFLSVSEIQQNLTMLMALLVLFMKMGMYPFSSWALKFISSIQGLDYWMFLTIMKIIPLMMCIYMDTTLSLILMLLNWLYACFILNYYSNYKKIIFFSSISNTSIFFTFLFLGFLHLSKIFLLFYLSFITLLIFYLEKMGYDFIFSGKKSDTSFLLFSLVLGMVGVPFLWGFVIKIMFIFSLSFASSFFMYLSIFFTSLVFSFFYIKLIFFYFLSNNRWTNSISFNFTAEKSLFFYYYLFIFPLLAITLFLMGGVFFT